MKKVKALHFWIDSYTEIEKSVEELRLAFDFVKEGIVSEEEVDENLQTHYGAYRESSNFAICCVGKRINWVSF